MPTIEELHDTLPIIAPMLEWADHHTIYVRVEREGWSPEGVENQAYF